jgi:AraC-like DNA-binding protein
MSDPSPRRDGSVIGALGETASARLIAALGELLCARPGLSLDEAAARLGVHRRTIRRALTRQGLSFRGMRDAARAEAARAALAGWPPPSKKSLAFDLGFQSPSAFSRFCAGRGLTAAISAATGTARPAQAPPGGIREAISVTTSGAAAHDLVRGDGAGRVSPGGVPDAADGADGPGAERATPQTWGRVSHSGK